MHSSGKTTIFSHPPYLLKKNFCKIRSITNNNNKKTPQIESQYHPKICSFLQSFFLSQPSITVTPTQSPQISSVPWTHRGTQQKQGVFPQTRFARSGNRHSQVRWVQPEHGNPVPKVPGTPGVLVQGTLTLENRCKYMCMAPRSFPAGSKTTFLPICLCNDLLYSSSSCNFSTQPSKTTCLAMCLRNAILY